MSKNQNQETQTKAEIRWSLILGVEHDDYDQEQIQLNKLLGFLYGSNVLEQAEAENQSNGGISSQEETIITEENKNQPNSKNKIDKNKLKNRNLKVAGRQMKIGDWLVDIKSHFSSSVVKVMENDAIDLIGLSTLILEPEVLENLELDVELAVTILKHLKSLDQSKKAVAKNVIDQIVKDILKRIKTTTISKLNGALNKNKYTNKPNLKDINWHRTIKKNLKNYQPDKQLIFPESFVGNQRLSKHNKKHIILCIDQSGSMGESVIYSAIFGSILASIPSLKTDFILYDTEVVDLTEQLLDPVDILFSTSLGGGNDTPKALTYAKSKITSPENTIFILISDLYEGSASSKMISQIKTIKATGVNFITLLALNDDGSNSFDQENAKKIANLKIPTFACTPDMFTDLIVDALG
jgi:VWA domain containing CoxE-like protein